MHRKAAQQVLLKVFSMFMIFGGLVRLVANQQTFQSFTIGELWVSHPYFIYIYRVLGVFVIFTGVTIFMMSQDPVRHAGILRVVGFCFLLISCVMGVAGYVLDMSLLHYVIDAIFALIIAALCLSLGSQRVHKLQ
jgi:hypothetical protein